MNASGVTTADFGFFPTHFSVGAGQVLHLWLDPTHTMIEIGTSASATTPLYQFALASLPALSFQLTDATSELILDYTNGSPLPTAGATLDGGDFSSSTLLLLGAGQSFNMTNTQIGLQAGTMLTYANLGTLSIQNSTVYYIGDLSTLNFLNIGAQSTFYWTFG